MVDKILNLLDEAKNNIKNKAENISASAKNQYEKMVEDWIKIIPQIEESGLQLYSFSFSASLNPSIDAEFRAKCVDFPLEKWEELISLNEKNKFFEPIRKIFNADTISQFSSSSGKRPKMNKVFATNSNFLISISLQPCQSMAGLLAFSFLICTGWVSKQPVRG